MEARSVLVIVAVAMLALVIGQVQAESITVPNGEFQIYKPGTDYTVLASYPAGNVYSQDVGDNLEVRNGTADYADGTTGEFVDMPGWVLIQGTNDLLNNGVDGSVGFNAFAAWGGDCRVETADSLGLIEGGATYMITAMINGPVSDGPLAFYLMADGVEMTPSSVVDQVVPVTSWQQISRSYDAAALADHVGESITIIIGVKDENDLGDRMRWDNITLDFENPLAPFPGYGETVMTGEVEMSWTNLPNDSNDVYVDVWFGTEPNELHPGYDMAKIVTAGENTTAVTQDLSGAPDTYYWRINSYFNGLDKINDANMLEGAMLLFHTSDDLAPTVEIVTLDQMTWSGGGVPLDSTVTDDGVSTPTVEWTADDDSLADPNLTIGIINADQADATVTITKAEPTGGVVTVTMTVTVGDVANPEADTASVRIDVYDDACQMARVGQGKSAITDFDGNCITGIEELAEMAAVWLESYAPTGPVPRP